MTGGCRVKPLDGESAFRGLLGSWYELRFLHHGLRRQLEGLGRSDVRIALTEGNMVGPGTPIIGKPYEHGMGRALAEAAIFPERIRAYSMVVHHDLVRSDRDTWFCRVFYNPDAPPGQRYSLPTDGAVMQIAGEHALNAPVWHDVYDLAALSRNPDGFLLTVGNPLPEARPAQFSLAGIPDLRVQECQAIVAENLDSPAYTVHPVDCATDGAQIRLALPPFSYVWLRFRDANR